MIEGLPNNRPGFGRVLNHDGSSFPMACHGHGFWERLDFTREPCPLSLGASLPHEINRAYRYDRPCVET